MIVLGMDDYCRDHLSEHFRVHYWPDTTTHHDRLNDPLLKRIRAVQTNGSYGLKRPMIEAMTNLEIVCAVGAGFEGIDLAAARERGIIVTNSPGANADSVADQAWALILGILRRVPACDAGIRAGRWKESRVAMPIATGKRLGIYGLGHVGKAVARRGAAGFGMDVGYTARTPKPESGCIRFRSLVDLADWADILVVCAPSTPETYHSVNTAVLHRLGPQGYLVNISRGALVDSEALAAALFSGAIAGAGLDVIEGEPKVPQSLLDAPNLVLSPHIGGFSPEAIRNTIHLVRDNLDAHFAGRPVLTPLPEEAYPR